MPTTLFRIELVKSPDDGLRCGKPYYAEVVACDTGETLHSTELAATRAEARGLALGWMARHLESAGV